MLKEHHEALVGTTIEVYVEETAKLDPHAAPVGADDPHRDAPRDDGAPK